MLLGAILTPTDPVLACDVQVTNSRDRDRLRFGLTGEGGLNDGTAFPFVMLGLGLLGLHELGALGWRWWAVDVLWAVSGGLELGYLLGTLVGRSILYLHLHHHEALGADEFIALGLIALTYGLALGSHTYGFLAVFAAGLALRRIDSTPAASAPGAFAQAAGEAANASPDISLAQPTLQEMSQAEEAASGEKVPAPMMTAVLRFNSQLESFVEVGIVLAVGVASVVAHGISVTPLMKRYEARKAAAKNRPTSSVK